MTNSSYPAQIDTSFLPVVVDDFTPLTGDIINRLRSSILAIELSLGIKPAGIYSTVAARFTVLELLLDSVIGGIQNGAGVDTITALKALSAPVALTRMPVKGYYNVADGGGGDFYWDSNSTATDNGGTIIQLNAGGTGRWKRIFDDAVDIRWFGAKGDGIADDTNSIQNAVTAIIAAGGFPKNNAKIYFSPGKYRITNFINISSNVPFVFDGNKSLSEIIIDNTDDGLAAQLSSAPLIIKNLKFSGTYARAINLSSGTSTTEINNCEFTGCTKTPTLGTQSVIFIVGQSDVWITDNYFHGNGESLHTQKTYCIGNDTLPNAMYRWHITGNKIISGGTTNQIVLFDISDSEISNNYIDGYGRSAIWDGFADSYGILIYRTHFEITIPRNNKITNNILKNTAGSAVYLQSVWDSLVDGNTFIDCVQSMSSSTSLEVGVIACVTGENLIISNNTIVGGRSRGIAIESDGASIINNKIINCSEAPIFLDGDISNGVILGNRIDGVAGKKAEIQGSSSATFAVSAGNTVVITIDGYGPVTTTFQAGDNSLNKVVFRINQTFMANGQLGPAVGANVSGGGGVHDTLLIQSTLLGDNIGHTLGKVQIVSGTALTALGLTATTVYGGPTSGIVSSVLGSIANFRFNKNIVEDTYIGFYIGNTCDNCTFEENYVSGTDFQGYGIIGGSNNIFTGNHAINCGDRGIDVRFSNSLVQGNVSINNGTYGIVEAVGSNNRIIGNDFRNNTTGGALISGANTERKNNLINQPAITNDVISVYEYGAVGNGIVDDTAAIQAAINASFTAGRRVLFPAGDYKVTSQITIPEATTLFGVGSPPGGTQGAGNGYPTILHHFDGYLFVFNGANGSGIASGGGVEGLRIVQTFGPVSGTTPRGAAIVFTGSNVDHRINWGKIRNVLIEESGNDPWTWGIIMDGKDAYADAGLLDLFVGEISTHVSNLNGGAMFLSAVAGIVIYNCELYIAGDVKVTGTPLVSSAGVWFSNVAMGNLIIDYANNVSFSGGLVANITTTANTLGINSFIPGILTQQFTPAATRNSGGFWYEIDGYGVTNGRFRISKPLLLSNNDAVYSYNAAGNNIISMVSVSNNNDVVISRSGGHILLGAATNTNSMGANDILIAHNTAFRAVNLANNDTFNLIKTTGSDNAITVGGTTSSDLNLIAGASGTINLLAGATNILALTATTATVGAGITLTTTGSSNINLPNNGSARFQIEGVSVGATVIAVNLNTLTDGSNADALHTHSGVVSNQLTVAGLTTTGLSDGYFGYISASNTLTKTDATSMASSRMFGANEGTVGAMTVGGIIENAKFTTIGGTPTPGVPVYLAPGTEEASAAGKLTTTKPTTAGHVVVEVGISVDNANYAGLKTAKVLLQVKAPIQL